MTSPRELTRDEVQTIFLEQIRVTVNYWERTTGTSKEKLNGLAFSILNILDGTSALPAFKVIPAPHEDDKQYNIDNGDNWYPDDCDIAGDLHEKYQYA